MSERLTSSIQKHGTPGNHEVEGDEHEPVKVARLSHKRQLLLNILWFPLNTEISALLPIVLPTQILLFFPSNQVGSAEQATVLSWLVMAASLISLLMPPLIGTFSDRTSGGLGRRRPYLIAGGLLVIASTPLLVNGSTLAYFLAGLALLHIGMNIINPAYQSLVPDQVPEEQRGTASGYVGGLSILGSVASLGLAAYLLGGVNQQGFNASLVRQNAGIYYMVTATLMTIGILITVLSVREIPYRRTSPMKRETTLLGLCWRLVHHWIEPWGKYNFTVVFLTRTAIMLGITLFMTYVEYYFARVQNVGNFVATTALIAVLALGGGVVSGILSGVLSDRMKRRAPVVCIATLFMAATACIFVVASGNLGIWLWPIGILFGLGYGAFSSVDWALTIDALPSLKEAGKHLGLWNASTTIPAIMAPLLGSAMINIAGGQGNLQFGYRLIFVCATFFLVVAAVGILFVRERRK
ncbi:MAG TPA: MFS transporter [Ktedonobacteraceae bacterium]|jgi:MFS family permease|nr:MFS transporter [Ktedonobacteraceae bacterium]